MQHENLSVVIFEVAGKAFAVDLDLVDEVVPTTKITSIPNSPPFLLGLTAVRGRVVAVIDAAKRFFQRPNIFGYFLVCNVRGNLTAIAIDQPIIAGDVCIRSLEENESTLYLSVLDMDKRFILKSFERLDSEKKEDGSVTIKKTGQIVHLVNADLFVSHEMASKVGEVA
ncbi:MAG: chemotaxis protein CheW [Oligoflexia bacterium]|nr:chemotaxis protein CheW [Oligoflexia bacterium]